MITQDAIYCHCSSPVPSAFVSCAWVDLACSEASGGEGVCDSQGWLWEVSCGSVGLKGVIGRVRLTQGMDAQLCGMFAGVTSAFEGYRVAGGIRLPRIVIVWIARVAGIEASSRVEMRRGSEEGLHAGKPSRRERWWAAMDR